MPRSKRWWKPCPSHPPASQPPGLPRHTETSAPWQLSSQGQPSSDGPLVTATERMLLLACGPTWTRYTSLVGQRRSAWRTLASKGDPRRAAPDKGARAAKTSPGQIAPVVNEGGRSGRTPPRRHQPEQSEQHPDDQVAEGHPGRDQRPEQAGNGTGGQVPEALHRRQQPERRPTQLHRGQRGHSGVFGRLHTADGHPSGDKPGGQREDAGAAGGEAGVGQPEQPDAQDQDQDSAAAIPQVAGGNTGGRGGEVVGDIQAEGELGGPVLVAAGGEQLGGPQDEQGGGHVAELKDRHPDHQAAEATGQHWPDTQPQRLAFALLGPWGVADGIDDGQGGEQPGDDREGDGGADPDQADQGQGEQGTGDGAEVVHGSFEPIGPPVDAGGDDVGQQGVAGRDAQAAGGPGAGAEDADLPDAGGGADEAGEDGGGGVAGDGLGAAALGVVGDGAAGEPGRAGQPVGDAFDQAEGGGRGA